MQGCPMAGGGGTWMMIGVGFVWLLVVVTLLLSIVALVKDLQISAVGTSIAQTRN